MRLLFLSAWFPFPPDNGAKLRVYNLLRHLSRRHEVTLLSFADSGRVDVGGPVARSWCKDIHIVPWKPFRPHSLRAVAGFASRVPRSIADTFSPEMAGCMKTVLIRASYDAVVASQTTLASYHQYFSGLPALLEEVELGGLYDQVTHAGSASRRLRAGLTWAKHRRYLARLLRRFGACTVVSERERELLAQAVPGYQPIAVIPNCVELSEYEAIRVQPQAATLIFTGALSYAANHDAMCWFVEAVYPRIKARAPDARLTITGDRAGRILPPAPDVRFTGPVDDVRPLIASARISVAPIRQGGGTRLKILEAMALGTPVVATSKGAEGLEVVDGEHLLIADAPDQFAERVLHLLSDSGLRQRLLRSARGLVEERYSWEAVGPKLVDLVERVARSRTDRLR